MPFASVSRRCRDIRKYVSCQKDTKTKIHNKPLTGLTFGNANNDLFSIGLDRKICRIENYFLSMKKSVDKNSDPLVICYFQDFILVGTNNCQIRFFNPETLLCRRILAIPGVPLVRKDLFQKKISKQPSGYFRNLW